MKLEKKINFTPAFDRRDPDPKKDYGIHGVDMRCYLTGPEGVVQFAGHALAFGCEGEFFNLVGIFA